MTAHMTEYYIAIKSNEIGDGGYPSFAETYFGALNKWYATKEEAVEEFNTYEDWEQTMIEIREHTWVEAEIPF